MLCLKWKSSWGWDRHGDCIPCPTPWTSPVGRAATWPGEEANSLEDYVPWSSEVYGPCQEGWPTCFSSCQFGCFLYQSSAAVVSPQRRSYTGGEGWPDGCLERANMELQSTTPCFKQSSCPWQGLLWALHPPPPSVSLDCPGWFIVWTKRKITPFGCISLDRSRSILGMFCFVLVCWWFFFFFFSFAGEYKMRLHSLV